MTRISWVGAAWALAVLLLAVPVAATEQVDAKSPSVELIDAKSPERILEIAKGFGSADMDAGDDGTPRIVGSINGTRYAIFFYGCEEGRDCVDFQMMASWATGGTFLFDDINRWNRTKRYGRAYIDHEGDPALDMIVNIDYGVTVANLEDWFSWWTKTLDTFKTEMLGQ